MRKLSIVVTSGLALLGLATFGSQAAWATHAGEPEFDCRGKAHDVQGFHFLTDPTTGDAAASVFGGAALCGTELDGLIIKDIKGAYKEGYILTPGSMTTKKGVQIRCGNPYRTSNDHQDACVPYDGANQSSGDFPVGTYFGSSGVDIQLCLFTGGTYDLGSSCSTNEHTFSSVYIGKSPLNPASDKCNRIEVVVCAQSTDLLSLGYGNITVEACWKVAACAPYDPKQDRYLMHIWLMKSISAGPVYYTEIGEPSYNHGTEPDPRDYQQCDFANVTNPGSKECGTDPTDWIQKNPPAAPGGTTYGCTPTRPEGSSLRAIGVGSLAGVPKDKCSPITFTNP